MADLKPIIEEEAAAPLSSESDGHKATGRPLSDLIEADRYLKSADAGTGTNRNGGPKSAWRGVRMARAIPPGSV